MPYIEGIAEILLMSTSQSFVDLTEIPGATATGEQLDMMLTRYVRASALAANKRVVEYACGPGIGLAILGEAASELLARDIDPNLVKMARETYGDSFDIGVGDACKMDLPDRSVDVVILFEAVYFLPDPKAFYVEALRVLKPSGQLFVCSANPERTDFNPSPGVFGYYSASSLAEMAHTAGFSESKLYGCFGVGGSGESASLLGTLRRIAVKYNLIPGSMRLKAALKRLLFSGTRPLPARLEHAHGTVHDLVSIEVGQPVSSFKVVYQICQA